MTNEETIQKAVAVDRNDDRFNKNSRSKNRKTGMAMGDNWKREMKEKKEEMAPSLGAGIDGDAFDGGRWRRGAGFRGKK